MTERIKSIINSIVRLFRKEKEEETFTQAFELDKTKPVTPETEETDLEFYKRHFAVPPLKPDNSMTRFSGQRVPTQTHGRPLSSYSGPGIKKLQSRGRKSRQFQKRSGVDHSLTMRDIEGDDRRRRRRRN